MSVYEKLIEDILEKKKNKENGNYNMIPISYQRYAEYFEGFTPGDYIGLLGGTGGGKSRLTRSWMYDAVDFAMKTGYKLKVLYFALEDPKIPVAKKIMSHYLYTRHNVSLSSKALSSQIAPLPDKYLQLIENDKGFWYQFYNIVHIINDDSSPNQIEKRVLSAREKYPDHHIIVIIDNQSNITQDAQDASEWAAIKRLSRDVIRLKFCPLKITTITVLQLDFETEKATFRNAGKGTLASIEPNLASVGDAKVVIRSMHYVFALFDPWRFEIKEYPFTGAYKTEILRGRFRSLIHLKTNEGEIAPRLGLYFDGKHEIFSEMPLATDTVALEKIYKQITDEERERINKLTGKLFQ